MYLPPVWRPADLVGAPDDRHNRRPLTADIRRYSKTTTTTTATTTTEVTNNKPIKSKRVDRETQLIFNRASSCYLFFFLLCCLHDGRLGELFSGNDLFPHSHQSLIRPLIQSSIFNSETPASDQSLIANCARKTKYFALINCPSL